MLRFQIRSSTLALLAAGCSICVAPGAGAMGGRSMPSGNTGSMVRSPQEQAIDAYNSGVKEVGKAKDDESDASKATNSEKKDKALAKAQKSYASALGEFEKSVNANPGLFQAWNYIGFCQRHLGRYEEALTAYGKALELEPRYGEAYEYRAEAYLGLNRIEDAKASYMQLFSTARPLADELMTSMHHWVEDRQHDTKGVSAEDFAAFAKWVDERATIAQQTASLWFGSSKKTQVDWN
jgi:tetratricopeptide (TPR) repeat protein